MNEHEVAQNGPPTPVRSIPRWLDRLATTVVVAGGLVAFPAMCIRSGALGATRSARLLWERRQALTQEAAPGRNAQTEPGLDEAPPRTRLVSVGDSGQG